MVKVVVVANSYTALNLQGRITIETGVRKYGNTNKNNEAKRIEVIDPKRSCTDRQG